METLDVHDTIESWVDEALALRLWDTDRLERFLHGWVEQRRRAAARGDFPPNVLPMPLPASVADLYDRWRRADNVTPLAVHRLEGERP